MAGEFTAAQVYSFENGVLEMQPGFNEDFNKAGRPMVALREILGKVVTSADVDTRETVARVARDTIVGSIQPPLEGEDLAEVVGAIWDARDGRFYTEVA